MFAASVTTPWQRHDQRGWDRALRVDVSGLRWVDVGASGQVWAGMDADGHCHLHGHDRRHGWGLMRVGIGVGGHRRGRSHGGGRRGLELGA